ncbi:MAG: GntR family transcriptional regulator [Acidimicrobiia bacterium]|nr:GntR family transcriptional regulator [Acidimicrobiia bacterium]
MTAQGPGPVGHRTAQAAVAEMLRAEILSGRMPSRTRLLQSEIAQRFATSTTPVREALRQLVGEGLLDGDPHRGVTVHEISLGELEEIYEIRLRLEPLAMEATVTHITDDDISAAGSLIEAMEAEEDPAAWTELNARFHAVLAGASGRTRLSGILTNLRNLSALYIVRSLQGMPDRIRAGNREHRDLLEAIAAGDVNRAQEVELLHLRHTLEIGEVQLQEGG